VTAEEVQVGYSEEVEERLGYAGIGRLSGCDNLVCTPRESM